MDGFKWPEKVKIVTEIKSPLVIQLISRMVNYIYKNCKKIFVTSPSFVESIMSRVPKKRDNVIY